MQNKENGIVPYKEIENVDINKLREGVTVWTEIEERFGDGKPFDRDRIVVECKEIGIKVKTHVIELGRRLVLLKKLGAHGSWYETLEEIGIPSRTATRYMGLAIKYLNDKGVMKYKELEGLTQKKLEALSDLEDSEIEQMVEDGSIANIHLDELQTMGYSELRQKIKDYKSEKKALEDQITEKNKKIDEMDREIARLKNPTEWSDRAKEMSTEINVIRGAFMIELNKLTLILNEIEETVPPDKSNEQDVLIKDAIYTIQYAIEQLNLTMEGYDGMVPYPNEAFMARFNKSNDQIFSHNEAVEDIVEEGSDE